MVTDHRSAPVWAMIPCRAGSQRIPRKNVTPLPGLRFGLFERKVRQIEMASMIEGIVVSTDDPEIVQAVDHLRPSLSKPVQVVMRPERFAAAGPVDEFVGYIPEIMPDGHVMWLHVTSPFFDANCIDRSIQVYFAKLLEGFDSLMTVTRVQTFFWDEGGGPLFDRSKARWPQTQDLPPVFASNFAAFLGSRAVFLETRDRVGHRPYLEELSQLEAFDVDWPSDLQVVSQLLEVGLNQGI